MLGVAGKVISLKQYLKETGISLAQFGERIGTTAQAVHRYSIGSRMPEPLIAAAIVRETHGRVSLDELNRAYLAYCASRPAQEAS